MHPRRLLHTLIVTSVFLATVLAYQAVSRYMARCSHHHSNCLIMTIQDRGWPFTAFACMQADVASLVATCLNDAEAVGIR